MERKNSGIAKEKDFWSIGDEINIKCNDGTCISGKIEHINITKTEKGVQTLLDINITEDGYYPGQHAYIWVDDIEDAEIINFKDEIPSYTGYEKFIEDCLTGIDDKDNYIFKLKRWREDIPFWCIFFCEKASSDVSRIKEHYYLPLKESTKMAELLNTLEASGIKIIVSEKYFLSLEDIHPY